VKLVELDAAQLPRSLADVDAAAINTNYALAAGLQPTQDAIALEDVHSPYANLIAVRAQDKDKPWLKKLVSRISPKTCASSSRPSSKARSCRRSDASGGGTSSRPPSVVQGCAWRCTSRP
jgi:NlpA lipoprotein